MIELLTLSSFEEFKKVTQQKLSLIAFGTPWSSPCQNQSKILVTLAKKYRDIMITARVDVEEHPGIASNCNIQSVPTLILYRKEKEIKRMVGLQSMKTLSTSIQAVKLSDINMNTADERETGLQFPINAEG